MLLFTLLVQLSFSLELCYSWFQKCLTKKLKQGPDLRYLRWPFGGGGYFGFSPFGFHLNLMRLRGMVKKDCCCWKIKTFHENYKDRCWKIKTFPENGVKNSHM